MKADLTVGEMAARAGVAVSALHFYEAKGLIASSRSRGNQRRYDRDVLRRIAIIKIAQRAGIPLGKIKETLEGLPLSRTPNAQDWASISSVWRDDLDARIRSLTDLRDKLGTCIGCGCLSMKTCPLYNPGDCLADKGSGAVLLTKI